MNGHRSLPIHGPLGETMRPILNAMERWGSAFKAGELPE